MSEQRAVVRAEHARIGKKIINHDTGGYGICAWLDCYRDATNLYEIRQHEHARNIPCDSEFARHVTYAFCRQKCKDYWLHSTGPFAKATAERHGGRIQGMAPPGQRLSVI